jgi:hypothetical protein
MQQGIRILRGIWTLLNTFCAISTMAFVVVTGALATEAEVRQSMSRIVELNNSGKTNSAEWSNMFTGELALFKGGFEKMVEPDKVIMITPDDAVARMPPTPQRAVDAYFYLRREKGSVWKAYAGRAQGFLLTQMLREEFRKIKNLSNEQKRQLANMELVLSTDADLKSWFQSNRKEFDALVTLSKGKAKKSTYVRLDDLKINRVVAKLHLSSASFDIDGRLNAIVGGILDNGVGYMFEPNSENVPNIDDSEFIWVEPLGDDWYLFRAT